MTLLCAKLSCLSLERERIYLPNKIEATTIMGNVRSIMRESFGAIQAMMIIPKNKTTNCLMNSANEIEKLIKHLKYRKFDKVIKRLDQQIKDTLDLGEQMEIIKAREDLKKTKNMLYSEVWALE